MSTTRALLLTDLVESTKLAETLGEARTAEAFAAHDRVARDLLERHRGREIDKTDGFLLLFESAPDAAAFALDFHRALRSLEVPLTARAGLHVGEVVLRENAPADVARGAKPLEVEGVAKPTAARVMSVALGGQTLMTHEAREALGATTSRIESHGHWRMKGLAEPRELFEIGDESSPWVAPPDGAKVHRVVADGDLWKPARDIPHELPRERDAFVGRAADLQALARHVDDGTSLVTVLGLGGTGKTRLVTRFGWTWLGDWPGGVWFCDLVEARSLDGITSAVARALRVELGADPVVQLGQALRARGRCLLILDNFEQVARHAADTVGRWIDAATEACFVVTTRELLGLPGERVLALAPLDQDAAVELFTTRAAAADAAFTLAGSSHADVAALVDLLDRLPLCIELAAARVRVMAPKDMVRRMGQRFNLLASGGARRDRQSTLRSTLDWSWDLLGRAERDALAQASVFAGGFTLAAAEAVLDLSAHAGAPWVIDVVQALVDKSLLVARGDGRHEATVKGDVRFDLLVSVQAYAAEKLAASGDAAAAESRHARYFTRMADPASLALLQGPDGARHVAVASAERDNLSVACRRAAARGDGDSAALTLRALRDQMLAVGSLAELLDLVRIVLAMPDLAPAHRFWTANTGMRSASLLEHHRDMVAFRDQSLTAGAACAGTHPEVDTVHAITLGGTLRSDGDAERRCYERALALAEAQGHRAHLANALLNLARCDLFEGNAELSATRLQRAVELLSTVHQPPLEVNVRRGLSQAVAVLGRCDEARAHLVAALERTRAQGHRPGEAMITDELATQDFELGRLADSRAGYAAAIEITSRDGNAVATHRMQGNVGETMLGQGLLAEARRQFEVARRGGAEAGSQALELHWTARSAEACWLQGDLAAAAACVGDMDRIPRDHPRLRHAASLVALADGRPEAARDLLEGLFQESTRASEQPTFRAQAAGALARVHLVLGNVAAAQQALAEDPRIRQSPHAAAIAAAYEALVAAAAGDHGSFAQALALATRLREVGAPGTEIAWVLAQARAKLPESAR